MVMAGPVVMVSPVVAGGDGGSDYGPGLWVPVLPSPAKITPDTDPTPGPGAWDRSKSFRIRNMPFW